MLAELQSSRNLRTHVGSTCPGAPRPCACTCTRARAQKQQLYSVEQHKEPPAPQPDPCMGPGASSALWQKAQEAGSRCQRPGWRAALGGCPLRRLAPGGCSSPGDLPHCTGTLGVVKPLKIKKNKQVAQIRHETHPEAPQPAGFSFLGGGGGSLKKIRSSPQPVYPGLAPSWLSAVPEVPALGETSHPSGPVSEKDTVL